MMDPIFYVVILIHATQLQTHDVVHYTDCSFHVDATSCVQLKTWIGDE